MADIANVRSLLALSRTSDNLSALQFDPIAVTDVALLNRISDFQKSSETARLAKSIRFGILLLYGIGRFESFVREILEDLATTITNRCGIYQNLPSKMREELIKTTAEVITDPRKYGHAEAGVRSFIVALSENVRGLPFNSINNKCLSITTANMRPKVMIDLFARVGIEKFWERLGHYAPLQVRYQTPDSMKASKDSQTELNNIMDIRNKIAHSLGSVEWPSLEQVEGYIELLKLIAEAIDSQVPVWGTTLGTAQDTNVETNTS